jgi:DNA polymerase-3 subunit chi
VTRVDFYVLDDAADLARERFACRLIDKAYRLRHRIFVHAADESAARRLDSMLWTFRDSSFVPHVLDAPDVDPGLADTTPVRIGAGAEPGFEAELMVNLGDEVPLFFSRFDRVAEIVPGNPEARDALRDRFRFYRDRGYELETHKIGSGGG